VKPANHWASNDPDPNLPPMGMRVRLKASYAIPVGFSRETKAILKALKIYGMMVADNGSNLYISGAPDPHWRNSRLVGELSQVHGLRIRSREDETHRHALASAPSARSGDAIGGRSRTSSAVAA
jgi:hypothetical protein